VDAGELKAVVKAFYEWQGQRVDDAKIDADVAVRPRTHALTCLLTYLPSSTDERPSKPRPTPTIELYYLYILWSELSRRMLSPMLYTAHYSCYLAHIPM